MSETKGLSISSTFTVNQRQQHNCQPPLSDKLVRVQLTSHLDNLLRLAGSYVAWYKPDKASLFKLRIFRPKQKNVQVFVYFRFSPFIATCASHAHIAYIGHMVHSQPQSLVNTEHGC